MDFKDYYATLGVSKTATDKEIKQAFRRLARKSHPDVNPGDKGAEARFKELNEANEVLSDPVKRKKYDELGANWASAGPQARYGDPRYGAGGPFGGPGGFRTMTEEEVAQMFGGGGGAADSPFSDFFRTFFGGEEEEDQLRGRRPRARPRAQKGRDVEHPIELDVEDALKGSIQRLSLRHDGRARTIEVRIPPGVTDGSRVRVANEGAPGSGSAPSGDLYLRVQLRPHPVFQVKGRDVVTRVKVPVTTAVLGGEIDVVTPGGKPLRLKLPASTQNGQRFRLRGHGFPTVGKPDERGDLFADVEVEVPRHLTAAEREHYEALRTIEADAARSRSHH